MRRQAASVIFLVLLSASLSFAQAVPVSPGAAVPPVIRFSGTLAIAAGHVPVTFGLYSEETGGAPLWVETQTLMVDAAGRYQVVLGTTRTLPADVFASGEARWLDVAVEGFAPQPRRLLVSVPYAMKAADAETIGGKPLSAFVLAGEKTGVGADGLTYVDRRVLASGMAVGLPSPLGGSGAAGGAGTANFIGVFTDATTLGNSVIYQAPGGYLGMNTTAPQAAFHAVSWAAPVAYFDVFSNALTALPVVYRAARGTPASPTAVQANDILGGLAVRAYGATTWSTGRGQVMYKAAENWTDAAQGTYLQFTTTPIGSVTWAERMRIAPDGKVGIGTPTPGQMLSVAGTVESTSGGFLFPDGTVQTSAARISGVSNVAFGTLSLSQNTTGHDNAAFGHYALSSNTTGTYNTAIGRGALAGNTTGYSNTASGAYALVSNTTGGGNTATGESALVSNTTGNGNTAVGAGALYLNTTGYFNTASGREALNANTTGYENTASGTSALAGNTTGVGNTAGGAYALAANTTGYDNTAHGLKALYANTTGVWNTASGALALSANTTGVSNTASGGYALAANTVGSWNTAVGLRALGANTTGDANAASGFQALAANTTGNWNTASGSQALAANTTGISNTANGERALYVNTTGNYNTATGVEALAANTTGFSNTADGTAALTANTTGHNNTASGNLALGANTIGNANTASGQGALGASTEGSSNSASGSWALAANTVGSRNTASGANALGKITVGDNNTALGHAAGYELTTGSNNIHIGNSGEAADDNTIRIGSGQARTFIAAIRGVTTGSADAIGVTIDSHGQLGTYNSSRRVKDDIADMAGASSALMQLRPVTFHYKSDRNPAGRTLQYGLIAEEVAAVYPRLVAHSADGQIETVMYQFLPPMLLNEYQKQERKIESQDREVESQQRTIESQQRAIEALRVQVDALTQAVAALRDRKR